MRGDLCDVAGALPAGLREDILMTSTKLLNHEPDSSPPLCAALFHKKCLSEATVAQKACWFYTDALLSNLTVERWENTATDLWSQLTPASAISAPADCKAHHFGASVPPRARHHPQGARRPSPPWSLAFHVNADTAAHCPNSPTSPHATDPRSRRQDLKPENLCVSRDGTLKIIDFGARAAAPGRSRGPQRSVFAAVALVFASNPPLLTALPPAARQASPSTHPRASPPSAEWGLLSSWCESSRVRRQEHCPWLSPAPDASCALPSSP